VIEPYDSPFGKIKGLCNFYRFFLSPENLFLSGKRKFQQKQPIAGMEEESGYYVNEVDGLPNEHPAMPSSYQDDANNTITNEDSFDDLPTSLIVTNIHPEVFINDEMKAEMESVFRQFSDDVTFSWLKSFRRLRVNYNDAVSAGEFSFTIFKCQVGQVTYNFVFVYVSSKCPNTTSPV
jgi:hypothetical protein